MTNIVDQNGIQIDTLEEITESLETSYKEIYGNDINLDQNSPDGQTINIFAQSIRDLNEKMVDVFNSFDPDQASGKNLDARVSINLIERRGGTYTQTDVELVTDRALNLIGLDGQEIPSSDNTFTIKDSEGNLFYLLISQSIVGAGTYTFKFRAAVAGEVQVTTNTLTIADTVVTGVISTNNPSAPDFIGIDQETDANLRIRRQESVALNSVGFFDSMVSSLNDLNNVNESRVYENSTSATDADGIPPHSYWIIVNGGTDEEVATTIYNNRSGGSGLRGTESFLVTQIDGSSFEINFDRSINEDLYIKFEVQDIITGNPVDIDFLKSQIAENISYGIGATANKTDIECFVKTIDKNLYVKDCQVSNDDIVYTDTLETATKQHKFSISEDRIDIINV